MKYEVLKGLKYNGVRYVPEDGTNQKHGPLLVDLSDKQEVTRLLDLGVIQQYVSSNSKENNGDDLNLEDGEEEEEVTLEEVISELTKVNGISDELAEALFEKDILDIVTLAGTPASELTSISGIGDKSVGKILESAQKLLKK